MSSIQDEELASARSEKPDRQEDAHKRSSRRKMLHKGLAAAAATVGAGVLLEKSSGIVHAAPLDNVGNFSSSNASVPAVTATGTSGATGVKATSDTSNGLYASSNGYDAIHAVGNTAGRSGVFAEGGSGYGVFGLCQSGIGIFGQSDTNVAVYGNTASGTAVYCNGQNGHALVANGHVQVQGNSVGQATLAAGTTSVTVTTSAATASSNILLTPLGNPKGNLWVTRASGSFTIHISAAPSANLSIAYLIIN